GSALCFLGAADLVRVFTVFSLPTSAAGRRPALAGLGFRFTCWFPSGHCPRAGYAQFLRRPGDEPTVPKQADQLHGLGELVRVWQHFDECPYTGRDENATSNARTKRCQDLAEVGAGTKAEKWHAGVAVGLSVIMSGLRGGQSKGFWMPSTLSGEPSRRLAEE